MLRNSLKAGKPFKSPMAPYKKKSEAEGEESEYEKLKAKAAMLDKEIKVLEAENISVDDLKDYIELLHKYNEYKDMAQALMGQIALLDGVMVKEVAARLDAPVENESEN